MGVLMRIRPVSGMDPFGLMASTRQHCIRRPAALVFGLFQPLVSIHLGLRLGTIPQVPIGHGKQVVRGRFVGIHFDDLFQIEERALIVVGLQI